MDLKGFGMAMWNRKVINLVKKVTETAQNNYPEMMGKMFLVNAPFIFSACWSIIKVWLDERVKNKISIMGTGFYKDLAKYIDHD